MRSLFADLAAQLDAAYAAHAGDDAREAVAARFDAMLDERAAQLLPSSSAQFIDDPRVLARFETSVAAASAAAALLGLTAPTLETFAQAGVDLPALGAAMSEDAHLIPVIAPHGLGPETWMAAFTRSARHTSTDGPGSITRRTTDPSTGPTLQLAAEALREFAVLDAPPGPVPPTPAPPIVRTTEPGAGGSRRTVSWTLRLVPAGQTPPLLGLSFAHGPHVSLPEMLMMQLMRLELGTELLDRASFTWLNGALADGRLAARHVYDESERVIRITCREVHNQGPHLGARPPVWHQPS